MFVILAHLIVHVLYDFLCFLMCLWYTFSCGEFYVWHTCSFIRVCTLWCPCVFSNVVVIYLRYVLFCFGCICSFIRVCALWCLCCFMRLWCTFRYGFFYLFYICLCIRVFAFWCSCGFLSVFDVLSAMVSFMLVMFGDGFVHVHYDLLVLFYAFVWYTFCYAWSCRFVIFAHLFVYVLYDVYVYFNFGDICSFSRGCAVWCSCAFLTPVWYAIPCGSFHFCYLCWFIRVWALWCSGVVLCFFAILWAIVHFMFVIFAHLCVHVLFDVLLCFYAFSMGFQLWFILFLSSLLISSCMCFTIILFFSLFLISVVIYFSYCLVYVRYNCWFIRVPVFLSSRVFYASLIYVQVWPILCLSFLLIYSCVCFVMFLCDF